MCVYWLCVIAYKFLVYKLYIPYIYIHQRKLHKKDHMALWRLCLIHRKFKGKYEEKKIERKSWEKKSERKQKINLKSIIFLLYATSNSFYLFNSFIFFHIFYGKTKYEKIIFFFIFLVLYEYVIFFMVKLYI